MPRKKADTSKSSENKGPTAPASPKKSGKQPKTDTTAQQITVRRTSTAEPMPTPEPDVAVADSIENPQTDKAVDDIMAEESDLVLAASDIIATNQDSTAPTSSWLDIFRNKWTWVCIVVVLAIVFGVPDTRYKLLGLVFKQQVGITVIDSQTKTPVSDALVNLAGVALKTDANGTALLKAGVGERTLIITKQYYRAADSHYFVGLKNNPSVTIKLIATGRLVPITIDNTISGKPLPNAVIHILNTTAKTNNKGLARVALPAGAISDDASISLAGYNTKQVSVQVTSLAVPGNSFNLTPSGSVYFLSNQSGTIDVVKSNLDGSNRQTVLAGTGQETASTTRLLASSDWHYLALEADRTGNGAPALYLINTSNNQVSEFDSNSATFNLIGWYGHNFVYSLTSTNKNQWQAGYEVIKDYNADQSELNQLDQNLAVGSAASYAYQNFSNFFIVGGALVYDTQWTSQGGYDVATDSDTIRAFQFESQVLKDYESFPADSTASIMANRYEPQSIYFAVLNATNSTTAYYQYNNQNVQSASINQTIFNQSSPAYLLSPSGSYSVWSELSNGQNVFLKGNASAAGQQQIASLDNYVPYGWYSDNYVLASLANSQLYILPASGLSSSQQPTMVTSYYEPAGSSNYEYGAF